jgi:hypothetical protein
MSEYSDSYHIRTDDPVRVRQRLRQARMAGLVFGPANGWLTFVPYEDNHEFRGRSTAEGFTQDLSRVVGGLVLHYTYGEDHGWGFSVTQPGKALTTFECWWDPAPSVQCGGLDEGALSNVVAMESIAPLLREFDVGTAAQERPAHRFAELLKLPAYKWLSPHLAQYHTEDLIAQGGSKLGTKPRNTAQRLQLPPHRKVVLPRPDLSAKEALELARPFMSKLGSPWFLASLFGGGRLKSDGRLEPGVGVWQFTYAKPGAPDFIYASLFFNGNLGFRGDSVPAYLATQVPEPAPLPPHWLDSTDAAAIIEGEPLLAHFTDEYSLSMSLRAIQQGPLWWEVTRTFVDRSDVFRMVRHNFAIDAGTGEIVAEKFEQQEGGRVVESRQRLRWEGDDWKNDDGTPFRGKQ